MNRRSLHPSDAEPADTLRERIIMAASELITAAGRDAATTRAVASAADVQAPAIYRIFGDKRGLLDAVAEHGLATYVAEKSARDPHPDPVEDLRQGWDVHVEFGLTHPGLFRIMSNDSTQRSPSPAISAGAQLLRRRINNIALAGRLKVTEDRAVALLHATCIGIVQSLLRQPENRRDLGLSAEAREAVLFAITTDDNAETETGSIAAAVTLRASLKEHAMLSAGEQHLLGELLDRIASSKP